MVSNNEWVLQQERIEDQQATLLPPTWLPKAAVPAERVEQIGRVFQSGPQATARRRLVEMIGQARSRIVACSFLIADRAIEDALLAAARRGVRVYVLLASEARLGKEPSDGEFDQRVVKEHWEMLERLGGYVLFRSAPHFHAKVLVVDPDDQPQGLLSTANFTKEALTRNEELQVELDPAEATEVVRLLGWAMWETAEHEWVDPKDRFRAVKPLGKLHPPAVGRGVAATSATSTALRSAVVELIESAKSSLMISCFGFDLDHVAVQRLCERARDGIDVTVLARVRAAAMPALMAIAQAGGRVLGFEHLHGKAVCADSQAALVMTANLQADGLDRGFEVGLLMQDGRALDVHRVLNTWAEQANWELRMQPSIGDVVGLAKVWRGQKLEDMEIKEVETVDLGTVVAASAEDLAAAVPVWPQASGVTKPARQLRCKWRVEAPVLAPKADEVRRPPAEKGGKAMPYRPPVYREGKRKVVAVRTAADIEGAKKVREEVGAEAIVLQSRSLLS